MELRYDLTRRSRRLYRRTYYSSLYRALLMSGFPEGEVVVRSGPPEESFDPCVPCSRECRFVFRWVHLLGLLNMSSKSGKIRRNYFSWHVTVESGNAGCISLCRVAESAFSVLRFLHFATRINNVRARTSRLADNVE